MQTTSEQLCGRRSGFHRSNKEPYIELGLKGRFMQSRLQVDGNGLFKLLQWNCFGVSFEGEEGIRERTWAMMCGDSEA